MADEVNVNSNAEAAKYRRKAREYRDKVAELEKAVATLTTERDEALKAPTVERERIAELEKAIRTRTHKDAFIKLAKDKIKVDALDDAYALSGWAAASDEVDETNMGEAIGSLVESRPYLRVEHDPTPATEDAVSPNSHRSHGLPTPAKGAGRGPAPASNTASNSRKI